MLAKLNEGRRSTAALTGMMQHQRGKDARRFMILGENQHQFPAVSFSLPSGAFSIPAVRHVGQAAQTLAGTAHPIGRP